MGPVSPAATPSSAGFRGCCVVLAWAVGAGLSVETALRGKTSNRGMGCVNGWTPNSGLDGAPVGMDAYALGANTLSPFVMTRVPAADMRPMRIRSRRETCPSQNALTISARFFRAFSASRSRALDAFRGRYTTILLCLARARAPAGLPRSPEHPPCQMRWTSRAWFEARAGAVLQVRASGADPAISLCRSGAAAVPIRNRAQGPSRDQRGDRP